MNQNKLEIFNSNIIKWYPFKQEKTIMQIGENKYIAKELQKKFKNIKLIKNIEEIEEKAKYDYIIIYGYENYENIINKIIKNLNDSGKLLIIGNNQIGINNWSKYNLDANIGVLKLEDHHKEIKTIYQLKDELKANNLTNVNTFYAFPNYKTAELIVNEKFEIEKGHIEKYNPEIWENEIKVFDEIKVLKTIIQNSKNAIELLANSYFLEVSKEENDNDIKYISFNNCRKEQYQLITIIKDNIVEKIPANEKSITHINNMAKIIDEIKKENVEILDYVKDGKLYSKLIKENKTLDMILAENSSDINKLAEILTEFSKTLLENTVKYEECKNKINIKADNEEIMKNLNYLEKAYWDMVPKNCFYIDNKFVFFDQEWEKDYLPAEFIIYRSIINSYDLVRKINVDELLEKLNILQYKKYFEKIDEELRNEIIDKQIHEAMYKKDNLKAIDNLINENKSFNEENERKNQYIKKLEKYIEELKNDNSKKQEYIQLLEKSLEKKSKRKINIFKRGRK